MTQCLHFFVAFKAYKNVESVNMTDINYLESSTIAHYTGNTKQFQNLEIKINIAFFFNALIPHFTNVCCKSLDVALL